MRRRRAVSVLEFAWSIKVSCLTFQERQKNSHITATRLFSPCWDVKVMPHMEWKPSRRMQNKKIRNLFYLCQHLNLKNCLNYKKNQLLEENESYARQSKTFITTIVSNNNYNEITDSSEISSCYRKWIIFYLNSNATRITWQQHNSAETVSVLNEENTLAPEVIYCDEMF